MSKDKTEKKVMSRKTKKLIKRIRTIDPKAADWIMKNWRDPQYEIYGNEESLITLMIWGNTPQGHDYWSDIDSKLAGVAQSCH